MRAANGECGGERGPDFGLVRWTAFDQENKIHQVLGAGVEAALPWVRIGVYFFRKLLLLEHNMNTKAARRIAKKRTALMKRFLAELRREIQP